MKTSATNPLLIGCFGLAIGTLLPGCVEPYGPGYGPPQRVTTYHPGYEVSSLPPGYEVEVIGGTRYYRHDGNYYRPHSGGYVIVEAPHHDRGYDGRPRYDSGYRDRPSVHREVIITRLPPGYRTIHHGGGSYYQVNDTYYQQRGSGYIIVSRPY